MSTINVSDLQPVGFALFSDSESYMHDLNDSDLKNITGGLTWWILITTVTLLPSHDGLEPEKEKVCNPDNGECGYHDEKTLTSHS